MTMEKNGAISKETPCCGGGCNSKQASDELRQAVLFPETEKQADAMEQDLTKTAIDAVEKSSKPQQ